MLQFDQAYCLDMFRRLLAVDSTTGQYEEIQSLLCSILDELGYSYHVLRKGGVIADLGGEGEALAVTAHLDDIGLMVRKVNADGTLNVCPVGGLYPFYCVTENVRVHTRTGRVFTGTICRTPNSIHVTEEELRSAAPDFRTNVCVVLDEDVKTARDTRSLGIETGDMVALEPRFILANGYIKSRFVDDKVEALEFVVDRKTWYTGQPLMRLPMKKNILLAAITRNGNVVIPSGETSFQPGDSVIVVTAADRPISRLNDIFSREP